MKKMMHLDVIFLSIISLQHAIFCEKSQPKPSTMVPLILPVKCISGALRTAMLFNYYRDGKGCLALKAKRKGDANTDNCRQESRAVPASTEYPCHSGAVSGPPGPGPRVAAGPEAGPTSGWQTPARSPPQTRTFFVKV